MRSFELRLIEVLKVQSYSGDFYHMSKFICKKINQMGLEYTKDKLGNIYVEKGDAEFYPTMVSHIDTVHIYNKGYQVHQAGRNIFAINKFNCERLGVGGDDKVGVFLTLEFLRTMDNFKAVFFVDEEIGCVGSASCNFKFFDNSSFVLECDRKGNEDFVNNISGVKLYSKEFSDNIKPILGEYLRDEVWGGMTDVLQIARKTDLCVANMSCGYYEPHSDFEYVNIDDVVDTYNMCLDMFEQLSHKQWTVDKEDRFDICGGYGGGYGTYYKYGAYGYSEREYVQDFDDVKDSQSSIHYINPEVDGYDDFENELIDCPHCGCIEAMYDEYDQAVYCFNCGQTTEIDDYIDIIESKL